MIDHAIVWRPRRHQSGKSNSIFPFTTDVMGSPSKAGRTRGFASAHWFAPQRLLQTSCCRLNFWSVMEHMMITRAGVQRVGHLVHGPVPVERRHELHQRVQYQADKPLIR